MVAMRGGGLDSGTKIGVDLSLIVAGSGVVLLVWVDQLDDLEGMMCWV